MEMMDANTDPVGLQMITRIWASFHFLPYDLEKGLFTNTISQFDETSVMNLGHGRAGHLPDYSFMRYKYLPAWGDYEECIKDNPSD